MFLSIILSGFNIIIKKVVFLWSKPIRMSELINTPQERLNQLISFAKGMVSGENGVELYHKYRSVTDKVTPTEAMEVLDVLLREGIPAEKLKAAIGKILNIFYKSLAAFEWEKPAPGHFIHYLMLENREVEKIMTELKVLSKNAFASQKTDDYQKLKEKLQELKPYELHYIKKENILFPYIEKAFPGYRCLSIMWSFHDDFRRSLKTIDLLLDKAKIDNKQLSNELGKLFFTVLPIIFREEHIVFPVALRAIPEDAWKAMMAQSFETGWCYIQQPEITHHQDIKSNSNIDLIDLGTGILAAEQIKLLLNTIPVDVTFIDENDEVRYFSGGNHRIFPRSAAIIGRKVQNCHPPESVHMVNQIVDAFKSGARDHADFWITLKGKFLHIRYFAVRNEQGLYKGTLEVSQDVTEIRALQGKRRLLEWE